MPRVKSSVASRRRRKKVLKRAKGYFGSKRVLFRTANEQVMRSLRYSYIGRKQRKREFRKLWIQRINAACKLNNFKYSRFIYGLGLANIEINRKMLADIAAYDPSLFTELVDIAKKAIEQNSNGAVIEPKVEEVSAPKTTKENVVKPKEEKPEPKAEVKEETILETKEEQVDLEKMTVVELKAIARERKITGFSTMKKAELIEVLK